MHLEVTADTTLDDVEARAEYVTSTPEKAVELAADLEAIALAAGRGENPTSGRR